jgi:glycerol-3-phosphate dehydrogenase
MAQYREKHKEKLKEYHKNYFIKNKDKIISQSTNARLKREYGIDSEEYKSILEKQKGCCAICGTNECSVKRVFSVDHNHTTKKVRGILCHNCNVLLGNAKENISILENAITYLKEDNKWNSSETSL